MNLCFLPKTWSTRSYSCEHTAGADSVRFMFVMDMRSMQQQLHGSGRRTEAGAKWLRAGRGRAGMSVQRPSLAATQRLSRPKKCPGDEGKPQVMAHIPVLGGRCKRDDHP